MEEINRKVVSYKILTPQVSDGSSKLISWAPSSAEFPSGQSPGLSPLPKCESIISPFGRGLC